MKNLIKSFKEFIDLEDESKQKIISALQTLQNSEVEEVTLTLVDATERQIAKEYVNRLKLNLPPFLYSSINWNQVYIALEREGLIRRVDDTITMKLDR